MAAVSFALIDVAMPERIERKSESNTLYDFIGYTSGRSSFNVATVAEGEREETKSATS